MSDDEQKPGAQPLTITAEGFLFPDDVLQQWVSIPPDEPLVIGLLTKMDLDHLLFSTARISAAINSLQRAVIDLSNNRVEEANTAMVAAANANIEGETHMRKLFFGIMKSVLEVRKNANK